MNTLTINQMENKFHTGEKAVLSLLGLFFSSICLFAQATDGVEGALEFRAGTSTSNITPTLGKGIVGGFGTPPVAEHVHDELHAPWRSMMEIPSWFL